ncbi:hypothetical protein TRIP_C21480 [Candidatus Zixiibacteriota bacterium]|nr:hypothetical protein TRIP_C21480 [candidate division Zixibacteria bacterium]
MRCQKVRYYLSAYCKGEMTGGRRKAVAAHLESCPECHREEVAFREILGATRGMPEFQVGVDFNSRLLSSIAEARFKETRSKAYLPKRIPIVTWTRALPAVAAACLVVAFTLSGGLKYFKIQNEPAAYAINAQTGDRDDRYLTVQPQPDHVLAQHASQTIAGANWTFSKQMARANRFRGLINSMVGYRTDAGYIRSMDNPFALIMFNPGHGVSVSVMPMTGNNAETKMVREAR